MRLASSSLVAPGLGEAFSLDGVDDRVVIGNPLSLQSLLEGFRNMAAIFLGPHTPERGKPL